MRDYEKVMELKYGENPHQRAAYYAESGAAPAPALAGDAAPRQAARRSTTSTTSTRRAPSATSSRCRACVIIKHNNPCGCALAENLAAAYDKALECDP